MTEDKTTESGFAFTGEERAQLAKAGLTHLTPDEAEWQSADYEVDDHGWVREGHKLHCYCNDLGMVAVHHYFPSRPGPGGGTTDSDLSSVLGDEAEVSYDFDKALEWLNAKRVAIQEGVGKRQGL